MLRTKLRRAVRRLPVVVVALWGFLILAHFPYDTDKPAGPQQAPEPAAVTLAASSTPTPDYKPLFAAMHEFIVGQASGFVRANGLQGKRVLEVGSGEGYLQDLVDDYTGLDLAGENRRFYHKPFVEASATAMPFGANEFDASWSFYVFEHVVNPESGLAEMRRVVKDGGLIFLLPAWNCTAWASNGYEVRPFSDYGLGGKLVKASLILRKQPGFEAAYRYPLRSMRLLSSKLSSSPTRLRFRQLEPNYRQYWVSDSDAVNSLDRYETLLWFRSRGDECLNCSGNDFWVVANEPLIIRVRKEQPANVAAVTR
jgi:SAM-dependent methyltransferase